MSASNKQPFNRERQPGKHEHKRRAILAFILGTVLLAGVALFFTNRGSSGPGGEMFSFHHMAMDTNIELKFESENRRAAEAIKEDVFAEIERLEGLLSRSLDGSDVAEINRNAGLAPVEVSPETMAVAQSAVEFARLSEGAFDPTIAPLMDQWGFLGGEFRVPTAAEIEAARALVDYTRLELDLEQGTIYLPEAGMSLDLGGIAKGYIVDRGMAVLAQAGVESAFLNAGGDIGLIGAKLDGTLWQIGVRHPRDHSDFVGIIPYSDGAIVTSGDYQRVFEADGERYHHILDPETGRPADSLTSVTVTAPTVMEADALSTAIFILGPERGLLLVEQLPGIDAILVTADLEVLISSGLKDIVKR